MTGIAARTFLIVIENRGFPIGLQIPSANLTLSALGTSFLSPLSDPQPAFQQTQWLQESFSIVTRGKLPRSKHRVARRRCCTQQESRMKRKCNFLKSGSAACGGKGIHVPHSPPDCVKIGNMHLLELAKEVKKGVEETGKANPFIFNTIGISDAISMGTEGMRSSLPSRDLIADSIECVVRGQMYDANVSLVRILTYTWTDCSLDATRTWYISP